MLMEDKFVLAGRKPLPQETENTVPKEKRLHRGTRRCERGTVLSAAVLVLIILGCLFCRLIMTKDPTYMDLKNCSVPPNREFLFGTDTMGRDIFSMIWYGGRLSLFIGITATAVSTVIAVVFGAVSGCAPAWLDTLMMRLTEILLAVPSLLVILLLQAVLGETGAFGISLIIGATGWMSIAKVVRTEVRQIRHSEYVIAARGMGGGFFYVLWRHLAPNFVPSVMFMAVMNIRNAIVAESTLSFMGIGLPLEVISWGSMLSLSEKALLTDAWWIILIPGIFLTVTLLCVTDLGNGMRKRGNKMQSNF